MSTISTGTEQLGELITMFPLLTATMVTITGGATVWRKFDRRTAVCALPLLSISGYNVALAALAVMGFIR